MHLIRLPSETHVMINLDLWYSLNHLYPSIDMIAIDPNMTDTSLVKPLRILPTEMTNREDRMLRSIESQLNIGLTQLLVPLQFHSSIVKGELDLSSDLVLSVKVLKCLICGTSPLITTTIQRLRPLQFTSSTLRYLISIYPLLITRHHICFLL